MGKEDMQVIEAKKAEGEAKVKKEKKAKAQKKMREKGTSFFSDFKKFITKGNVVDMAVAVMLGTAFNAIVNGLVKLIINPLIALFTQGISLDELKYPLIEEQIDPVTGKVTAPAVEILWGQWLQTVIDFFIIALTIFIIARIARSMMNRAKRKELAAKQAEEEKKKAEEKAKAEAAAAVAAEKEAQLQAFYANVARQTELLEELSKK